MKTTVAVAALALFSLTACLGGGSGGPEAKIEDALTEQVQDAARARQQQMATVQAAIDAAEMAIEALTVLSTDTDVANAQSLLDALQTAVDAGSNLSDDDQSAYAATQGRLASRLEQISENIETARRMEGEFVDPVDPDEANRNLRPVEFGQVHGSAGANDYERYDGWGLSVGQLATAQFSVTSVSGSSYTGWPEHKVTFTGFLPDESPDYYVPLYTTPDYEVVHMTGTATWEGSAIAVHDDRRGLFRQHHTLRGDFKMEVLFGSYETHREVGNRIEIVPNLRAVVSNLQGPVVGQGANYPDLVFTDVLRPNTPHIGGIHFSASLKDYPNVGRLRGSFRGQQHRALMGEFFVSYDGDDPKFPGHDIRGIVAGVNSAPNGVVINESDN